MFGSEQHSLSIVKHLQVLDEATLAKVLEDDLFILVWLKSLCTRAKWYVRDVVLCQCRHEANIG